MNQLVRNNCFETNSSSIHSLVIFKDVIPNKLDDTRYNLIPIMKYIRDEVLDDPISILSYLYTYSLVQHDWKLYDLLKYRFMDTCIFEKPCWINSINGKPFYIEDREITSFCELAEVDFSLYPLESMDRDYILSHLDNMIFNGIIVIERDRSFITHVTEGRAYIKEIVIPWDPDKESLEEWEEKHIEKYIEL